MKKIISDRIASFFKSPSFYLIAILTIEILYLGFLNINNLFPHVVDGFQYFHLQYYFLNHEVTHRETALWIPYLTQGTASTWWYSVAAGWPLLILSALNHISSAILSNINFLHIFNAEMIFEELVLGLGTWLLCRRYGLSALSCFYASTTMMLCSIWHSQPWYNFHLYYALPLILTLGHRFLDTGRWRWLFLSGNLLFLQTLGNLPYMIAFTSLCAFAYFVFWIATQHKETFPQIKNIRFSSRSIICLLGLAASGAAAFAAIKLNTSEFISFAPGRNADLTSSLKSFLTYGKNASWMKWDELLTGISPSRDITLFTGYFTIFFTVAALFGSSNRIRWALLGMIIFLVLLGTPSIISQGSFHLWPGMKYFRHIGMTAPAIKIFLVLLSAIGLEQLRKLNDHSPYSTRLSTATSIMIFIFAIVLFGLFYCLEHPSLAVKFFKYHVPATKFMDMSTGQIVSTAIDRIDSVNLPQQIMILIISLFASLVVMILLSSNAAPTLNKKLLVTAVILQIITLGYYKVIETEKRSAVLPDNQLLLTKFQPMPYRENRTVSFDKNDSRDQVLSLLDDETYGSVNMLLFKDTAGSFFRVDYWMKPFNDYLKAYARQNPETLEPPRGYSPARNLMFPSNSESALKISGVTQPKLQIFEQASLIHDVRILPSLIVNPRYTGDQLLIPSDTSQSAARNSASLENTNERSSITPIVTSFDANHLSADINVPFDRSGMWLHYADIWDPRWRAEINGRPVTVYRSNLAYKAVQLTGGLNRVHFYYDCPELRWIYLFWQMSALAWGILAIKLFWNEFRRKESAAA